MYPPGDVYSCRVLGIPSKSFPNLWILVDDCVNLRFEIRDLWLKRKIFYAQHLFRYNAKFTTPIFTGLTLRITKLRKAMLPFRQYFPYSRDYAEILA